MRNETIYSLTTGLILVAGLTATLCEAETVGALVVSKTVDLGLIFAVMMLSRRHERKMQGEER